MQAPFLIGVVAAIAVLIGGIIYLKKRKWDMWAVVIVRFPLIAKGICYVFIKQLILTGDLSVYRSCVCSMTLQLQVHENGAWAFFFISNHLFGDSKV